MCFFDLNAFLSCALLLKGAEQMPCAAPSLVSRHFERIWLPDRWFLCSSEQNTVENVNPSYHHQWCSWGKLRSLRWDLGGVSICPGSDSRPADNDQSLWAVWSPRPCGSRALQSNASSSSTRSYCPAAGADCRSRRRGTALARGPEPDRARPGNPLPGDRTRAQTNLSWAWLQSVLSKNLQLFFRFCG